MTPLAAAAACGLLVLLVLLLQAAAGCRLPRSDITDHTMGAGHKLATSTHMCVYIYIYTDKATKA